MNDKLEIEIITHITGSMNHCDHCQVFIDGVGIGEQIHRQDVQSYPEEFVRDWQQVSDWVQKIASDFPNQLMIKIIDAQSLSGLWKSLTKGVRRYPTFIIGSKDKYHGWDHEHLKQIIESNLK